MKQEMSNLQQDQEATRRQQEEREKLLQRRVDGLVKKFKGYIWRLALPGLFLRGLEGEAKLRRVRIFKSHADILAPMTESLKQTCKNIAVKAATDVRDNHEVLGI